MIFSFQRAKRRRLADFMTVVNSVAFSAEEIKKSDIADVETCMQPLDTFTLNCDRLCRDARTIDDALYLEKTYKTFETVLTLFPQNGRQIAWEEIKALGAVQPKKAKLNPKGYNMVDLAFHHLEKLDPYAYKGIEMVRPMVSEKIRNAITTSVTGKYKIGPLMEAPFKKDADTGETLPMEAFPIAFADGDKPILLFREREASGLEQIAALVDETNTLTDHVLLEAFVRKIGYDQRSPAFI